MGYGDLMEISEQDEQIYAAMSEGPDPEIRALQKGNVLKDSRIAQVASKTLDNDLFKSEFAQTVAPTR